MARSARTRGASRGSSLHLPACGPVLIILQRNTERRKFVANAVRLGPVLGGSCFKTCLDEMRDVNFIDMNRGRFPVRPPFQTLLKKPQQMTAGGEPCPRIGHVLKRFLIETPQ